MPNRRLLQFGPPTFGSIIRLYSSLNTFRSFMWIDMFRHAKRRSTIQSISVDLKFGDVWIAIDYNHWKSLEKGSNSPSFSSHFSIILSVRLYADCQRGEMHLDGLVVFQISFFEGKFIILVEDQSHFIHLEKLRCCQKPSGLMFRLMPAESRQGARSLDGTQVSFLVKCLSDRMREL